MDQYALLVAATLASGTPLALAGLGLLINEKAGVLNLGAEGIMLVAAIAGFAAAFTTGSDTMAFVAGAAAGALLAAAFGALVIWLNTNQYATGLAVSLFGYGFSAFVGALNEAISSPWGSINPAASRTIPPLPVVSMPCSTSSTRRWSPSMPRA